MHNVKINRLTFVVILCNITKMMMVTNGKLNKHMKFHSEI